MTGGRALSASLLGLLWVASATPVSAQLSGTYTLDPNGSGPRNYPTWGAAVQALRAGIAGAVVFQVAPTTFRETVILNPVPGATGCAVDIGADEGDTLVGSGTGRMGSAVVFQLRDAPAAALPYQLGTSLGTGPIPIDKRKLNLSPDNLLLVTVNNYWPSVFAGYRGVIDSKGQAQAAIHIPNLPALIGVRLHSAFVTFNAAAPSGVRSISNTFSFSVAK